MINRPGTAAGLCLLVLAGSASAQTSFPPEAKRLILQGIEQTLSLEFDSCLATFHRVRELMPGHPAGYLHEAAALQSMMMDYETDKWEERFSRCIDRAVSTADSLLRISEDDPWLHFYLGSARSYRGLYDAKSGRLISGFILAKSGLGSLAKAVELDTTLYDALLGLGSYRYWAGKYYRHLKWLPWIADEREQGIEQVRIAWQRGTFTRWVGLNSLAWIEWDRGNFEEALALFQQGLERFPGSRFFLWGIADTRFKAEAWEQALPVYREILASVRGESLNNGFNEVTCLVKLAKCCLETGRFEASFRYADRALEMKVERKVEKRVQHLREEADGIRHTALTELGRISIIE
ncbi:tetratricopeptide repeat protein [bacterium]|nr:tetratricopeptide repeat protein [bacterium]